LTGAARFATVAFVTSAIEPSAKTRGLRRVEYERLVELGMFTGERLELIEGLLVVREPRGVPSTTSQPTRRRPRSW